MEENSKKRNVRPEENSKLPLITLLALLGIIVALFFIGYEYITDDTTGSEEVTDIVPDTTSNLTPLEVDTLPELAEPEQIDTVKFEIEGSTPDGGEETAEPPARFEEEVAAPVEKKPNPKPAAVNLGGTEIGHTVRTGETFYGIANRYNLTPETLKSLNPQIGDVTKDLKSDVTRLNVRVQAVHTVGPGDVLRVVAGKYGISKQLLMQANGKERDYAERGEKLVVPFGKKK